MRFRLIWYQTTKDDKYQANQKSEYLGNQESIWHLWYLLTHVNSQKHVEIYDLCGIKQSPEKGLQGLSDSI